MILAITGLAMASFWPARRWLIPPAQCWPDIKILNELGKALTSKEYWYDDYEELLDEILQPSGLRYPQFR